MHGALGSVKATLSPSTGLVLTLLPSLVSMAYINSSAPNHFQLLSSAISLFAIVMGALALSSRVSSFSLSHGVVAFPTSTGTTRHPLLGFSHRPHLKCFAAALSSSVSGKQLSSLPLEKPSNSICYLVPTVEKEELARFAYAVEMGSNLVPLYRCIFCDHLTPILAYRCLVEEDDTESPSFLFESVEQGLTGSSVVGAFTSYFLSFCLIYL
ncbi:Anthranilate synthase component I-2, chloroplastic [Dendrobium catenatum]|uniref:Anthranilate synthase component I-2, chloroplastic n=1 Tax=Dendrobium catenatum TaxID=906689 RepID=A0A2I0VJC5_9ASPA|nr:Anthranilate synthase component I-2, chloroplastic [Dendrobium catenatum]